MVGHHYIIRLKLVIYHSLFEITHLLINEFKKTHILQGLEKITKILIDNGAEVDIRNAEGMTPLGIAAVNGNSCNVSASYMFIRLYILMSLAILTMQSY